MSALTLRLREAPPLPLDLSGLTPDALAGATPAAIARRRLPGQRRLKVGDVFDIRGTAGPTLVFEDLTAACHRLGAHLAGGRIEASGAVGAELGRGMLAGEIRLDGDAGEAVGAGMRGGHISVRGSAGPRLGGTLAGATYGMNGGTIHIARDAGPSAGERMRRGLILIGGAAGSTPGDRMLAGTVIVFGACGADAGLGNRRGSLLLCRPPAEMTATYNDCGRFELAVMALLTTHVASLDRKLGRRLESLRCARRWCGDLAHGGKGEILLAGAD